MLDTWGITMRHLLSICAAIALAGSIAFAATPDQTHRARPPSVLGLTIGQPIPFPRCSFAWWVEATPEADCYVTPEGDGTDAISDMFELRLSMATFAKFSFIKTVRGKVKNQVVSIIAIETFGNIGQYEAFESLKNKFGPPASVSHRVLENAFGAHFSATRATWRTQGLFVDFDGISGNIDTGSIDVMPLSAARAWQSGGVVLPKL